MMNIRQTMTAALVGAMALTAAACNQGTGYGNNAAIGTVGGAVVGGLLGNQIGSGSGRVAATIAGAALGGVLGGAIGSSLDAQERQMAYNAQYDALAYGRPTQWRSQRGSYGTVTPGRAYNQGGYYCREYSHTIYIDGRPQRGYGQACRQPDGSWQIVS
jgi:surface antigen